MVSILNGFEAYASSKMFKGMAAAGVLVAGALVGGSALKMRKRDPIKHLTDEGNDALGLSPPMHSLCAQMETYSLFHRRAYIDMLVGAVELVTLHAKVMQASDPNKLSNAHLATEHAGKTVEGVRTLRAHVKRRTKNNAEIMKEFDEIAADIQQLCNDMRFNVGATCGYRLTSK